MTAESKEDDLSELVEYWLTGYQGCQQNEFINGVKKNPRVVDVDTDDIYICDVMGVRYREPYDLRDYLEFHFYFVETIPDGDSQEVRESIEELKGIRSAVESENSEYPVDYGHYYIALSEEPSRQVEEAVSYNGLGLLQVKTNLLGEEEFRVHVEPEIEWDSTRSIQVQRGSLRERLGDEDDEVGNLLRGVFTDLKGVYDEFRGAKRKGDRQKRMHAESLKSDSTGTLETLLSYFEDSEDFSIAPGKWSYLLVHQGDPAIKIVVGANRLDVIEVGSENEDNRVLFKIRGPEEVVQHHLEKDTGVSVAVDESKQYMIELYLEEDVDVSTIEDVAEYIKNRTTDSGRNEAEMDVSTDLVEINERHWNGEGTREDIERKREIFKEFHLYSRRR